MKTRKILYVLLLIALSVMTISGCNRHPKEENGTVDARAWELKHGFEDMAREWSLFDAGLKDSSVQEFNITVSNGECTVSAGDQANFEDELNDLGSWGQIGKGSSIQDPSEATTPEEKIAITIASDYGGKDDFSVYVAFGDSGDKVFVAYTATEGAVLTPGVNCPKVGVSDDGMTLPKSFKFSKDVIVHTSDPVEAL